MLAPLAALMTLIILIGVFYNINDKQNKVLESLLIEHQRTSYTYTFLAHKLAINHADIFTLLEDVAAMSDEGEFYDKGRKLLLNIHAIEQEFTLPDAENVIPKAVHTKLDAYKTITSNVILIASVNLELARGKMNDSTSEFNELNNLLLTLSESSQKKIQAKIIVKKEELKEDAIVSISLALLLMFVSTSTTMILSTLLSKKLNYLIHYLRKMLVEENMNENKLANNTDELETLNSVSEKVKKTVQQLESEIENRKKAEDRVLELNHNLEIRVDRRTKDLQKSNDELKNTLQALQNTQQKLIENDKMASLGKLVAGIAHELNTPIGNALTSISLIEHKTNSLVKNMNKNQLTKSILSNTLQEMQEASSLSLVSIERAVEQIRSFKLVAVDTTIDDIREINLKTYVEDIARSLKPQLKKAGHVIDFICTEDAVVQSYPAAYVQIFTNLIQNSVVHAFDNNQPGCITIEVIDAPDNVKILYSDNGKGITADVQKSIFEPFFTTNRKEGGSGLGAHIIYNLVTQRLKGQIAIVNNDKPGLFFTITVPKVISLGS
jgi:signal transduction histidine kinase